MKVVYILRHAEKDEDGELTEQGKQLATALGKRMHNFVIVISSDSPRTKQTASLITGQEPQVEERAGYYMTSKEVSDAIFELAAERSITFLEAAEIYHDGELVAAIQDKASGLNQLVGEVLLTLREGEKALIVSHDMTMTPAMDQRGQPREPIGYLGGYVIRDYGLVTKFSPDLLLSSDGHTGS